MRLRNPASLPWTYAYYASLPFKKPSRRSRNPKPRKSKARFHHVRVAMPHLFKDIRTITFGKGIKARVGFRSPRAKSTVQSLMFDATIWTFSDAKKWAKKKGYKILKTGTIAAPKQASGLLIEQGAKIGFKNKKWRREVLKALDYIEEHPYRG